MWENNLEMACSKCLVDRYAYTSPSKGLPGTSYHSSLKTPPNIYLLDFDLNKKFQLFVLKIYLVSELKGTTCKTLCENISE